MAGPGPIAVDFVAWATAPSVIVWVGALAALAAAFAMNARSWLKSPRWLPLRLLGTVGVWVGVVTLITLVGQPAASESVKPQSAPPQPLPPTETVVVAAGQAPAGLPANVVLLVQFIPTEGDARVARDFACDLLLLGGSTPEKVEIRAQNMTEFEKHLVQQLRRLSVPAEQKEPAAILVRVPFPGEGLLRRVKQKVESVLPGVAVSIEGGSP